MRKHVVSDEKRKELMKGFIQSRVHSHLRENSSEIYGGEDNKVLFMPEQAFSQASEDIWRSIEEYFDCFLTDKTNGKSK